LARWARLSERESGQAGGGRARQTCKRLATRDASPGHTRQQVAWCRTKTQQASITNPSCAAWPLAHRRHVAHLVQKQRHARATARAWPARRCCATPPRSWKNTPAQAPRAGQPCARSLPDRVHRSHLNTPNFAELGGGPASALDNQARPCNTTSLQPRTLHHAESKHANSIRNIGRDHMAQGSAWSTHAQARASALTLAPP
jgi:hypothetical protein